jgi:hypothetical protein
VTPKPPPSGSYRVARSRDAVYVRVVGLANMNNFATFKDFAARMETEGFRALIIDLAECRGVDSSFMGTLIEYSRAVVIVNAGAHCRRQLESIGLHRVLKIQDGPASLPAGLALYDLPDATVDQTTRLKLILKAHQDLIQIDRSNEARFGPFLRDLQKNLGGAGK